MYLQAYNNFKKEWNTVRKQALLFAKEYFDDSDIKDVKLKNCGYMIPMGDDDPIFGDRKPTKAILEQYGDCIDISFEIHLHYYCGDVQDDRTLYIFFADERFLKVSETGHLLLSPEGKEDEFYLEIR